MPTTLKLSFGGAMDIITTAVAAGVCTESSSAITVAVKNPSCKPALTNIVIPSKLKDASALSTTADNDIIDPKRPPLTVNLPTGERQPAMATGTGLFTLGYCSVDSDGGGTTRESRSDTKASDTGGSTTNTAKDADTGSV